nr:MAG TPA: hypothetical protein [Bacteriophage sp.]DAH14119.1 MAG TPA: hypothetical protein [Caudoviricetes sp.]
MILFQEQKILVVAAVVVVQEKERNIRCTQWKIAAMI